MKRQLLIVSCLTFLAGTSVGYFLSLGSSFKKSSEVAAALPSAVAAMNDFSETDVVYLIRAVRDSMAGKVPHKDHVLLARLEEYYHQRSSLPLAQQDALTATKVLSLIDKLAEENEGLQRLIQARKTGSTTLSPSSGVSP